LTTCDRTPPLLARACSAFWGASRGRTARLIWLSLLALVAFTRDGAAQAGPSSLRVLNVPFVSQSESLCGGAAAAMVLRFWGERGVDAESFAHLVDRGAGGIRTTDLVRELEGRGFAAVTVPGSAQRLASEINQNGRPVLALIEDHPGAYHYVVVVGMPERGVIFHDPARSSYRVMSREEWASRWRPTSMWMALVAAKPARTADDVPVARVDGPPSGPSGVDGCETQLSEGVRRSQTGDYAGAEQVLTSALSCPGGAAYRELAGLRVLQKRWSDASSLAETAVQADANDTYAWRLLATARFLQDDRAGALHALNRAGEPALDTVQVTGLTRTRVSVVEHTIGVDRGEEVTQSGLDRGLRRLVDLPSLRSAALEYVPVPGGRAEVRAAVSERRLFPSDFDWVVMGARAGFSRDLRASIGAMTGGGERLDLQWRFRPDRERVAAEYLAPAPWGGVWTAQGSWERTTFDALVPQTERALARLTWTTWLNGTVKVGVRGGVDRWQDIATRPAAGATFYTATRHDRVTGKVDLDAWGGADSFSTARAIVKFKSKREYRGLLFLSNVGAGWTGDSTPVESWFAGDSGNARPGPVLLRAHGLVEDARFFRTAQMGRTIVHAAVEQQYWFDINKPGPGPAAGSIKENPSAAALKEFLEHINVGVAVFVDSARVMRRLYPGDRNDVDLGGGGRLALPGGRGALRADYARGLINTDWKISFGYER
jgi:predicted double-glycine peptidase